MNAAAYIAIALIIFGPLIWSGLRSAFASSVNYWLSPGKLPSFSGVWSAKVSIEWWKIVAIVLVVLLSRGGGWVLPDWKLPSWPAIGSSPMFPTDKLSVLVVEETLDRRNYTSSQLDAILSTDANSPKAIIEAKGGRFEVIDKDSADKLSNSDEWVKAAFAVKRDSLPWVVGSTPKRGFSTPLTGSDDLRKRVEGL